MADDGSVILQTMWINPERFQSIGGKIGSDEIDGLPRFVYRCKLKHVDIFTLKEIQHLSFSSIQAPVYRW